MKKKGQEPQIRPSDDREATRLANINRLKKENPSAAASLIAKFEEVDPGFTEDLMRSKGVTPLRPRRK